MSSLDDLKQLIRSRSAVLVLSEDLGPADSFSDASRGGSRMAPVTTHTAPTLDDLASMLVALGAAELRFASEPLAVNKRWRVRVGAFDRLL